MTHDLKALRELEKRLGEAKGPDREIDALLWAELDGRDVRYDDGMVLAKSRKPPYDECLLGFIDPGKVSRNFSPAGGHRPAIDTVTGSLDSAVALVERVIDPRVGFETNTFTTAEGRNDIRCWHATIHWYGSFTAEFEGSGNLALALCLACVRALISQGEQ